MQSQGWRAPKDLSIVTLVWSMPGRMAHIKICSAHIKIDRIKSAACCQSSQVPVHSHANFCRGKDYRPSTLTLLLRVKLALLSM